MAKNTVSVISPCTTAQSVIRIQLPRQLRVQRDGADGQRCLLADGALTDCTGRCVNDVAATEITLDLMYQLQQQQLQRLIVHAQRELVICLA